jgi:YbbR domain-containing protein
VSQDPVTVSGPDSAVRSVAAALARVRLDPSGIDVNETVGLVPVDARGEIVGGADVQPSAVRVTIQIGSQLSTKTLPVSPVVTGTPAASVEITSVEVQPALVTVEGEADALAGLLSIDTRPIAISGATTDVETAVGLDLPEGVAALGVEQVRVAIAIRPRTGTRTFEAGVQVVNGGLDLFYRPAIDRVLVTVGGTLQALDAVEPTRIAARLDVAGLGPGTSPVPVTVRLPAGVTLVAASPEEVTVTVTPLATPTPPPATPPPIASPTPTAAP